MQRITPNEFRDAVKLDPAWATTLTEPVQVTDYCDMENSGITHLSPLLHFSACRTGAAASFGKCKHLKVAEGNFAGSVHFGNSGIEKIGELRVTKTDDNGDAANFYKCENLKVAEGTFPGTVNFNRSGVERIGDLKISHANCYSTKGRFQICRNLMTAPLQLLADPTYHFDQKLRDRMALKKLVATKTANQPPLEI